MLDGSKAILLSVAVCFGAGCSRPAPKAPTEATSLARPEWVGRLVDEVEAARACVRERAPMESAVVHIQVLRDLRLGVLTLGRDGTAERCVFGDGLVEYRTKAKDVRSSDFVGFPIVWLGEERPRWAAGAYLEELVSHGATVAWVQWLGEETRK